MSIVFPNWGEIEKRRFKEDILNEKYEEHKKALIEYQSLLAIDPLFRLIDKGFVYFLKNRDEDIVKIGYSTIVYKRVFDVSRIMFNGNGILVGLIPGGLSQESKIHQQFHHINIKGSFELFFYTDSLRYFIQENMTDVEREYIEIINNRVFMLEKENHHYIVTESWAGIRKIPCEIVGETRRKLKVKLIESARLPNKRFGSVGDIILVPKHAVRQPNGDVYDKKNVQMESVDSCADC